ncbi:citrate lyase holo-[acyl-carrier protein] synthase [Streptococcus plurextorum]|uniref:citrate lyase holo-[acyl-carrier protein] synthase n=1 Tax=Streptococcus plurextorum TaxID=456876 RepID=UPI000427C3F5|nr:citrate lyase holo-[acyl-carrier protein] synthase [Streptococcus plurextorum]
MSNTIFDGPKVTLEDMLEAREGRNLRQQSLLRQYAGASLLSATMNIPGPIKTSKMLEAVFDQIIYKIESSLKENILFSRKLELKTGGEYYLVTQLDPLDLKTMLIAIEEETAAGRLMDLDVVRLIDDKIVPISRTELGLPARSCYICASNAKECSRSQKHNLSQIREAIASLLKN